MSKKSGSISSTWEIVFETLVHCLSGAGITEINLFLVSLPLCLSAVGFCHWPLAKPGLFGTTEPRVLVSLQKICFLESQSSFRIWSPFTEFTCEVWLSSKLQNVVNSLSRDHKSWYSNKHSGVSPVQTEDIDDTPGGHLQRQRGSQKSLEGWQREGRA